MALVIKWEPELVQRAFTNDLSASFRGVVLQSERALGEPSDGAFTMDVFFNDDALVLNEIRVKLVVVEAAIVLEVVWVAFDIDIINQIGELALLLLAIFLSLLSFLIKRQLAFEFEQLFVLRSLRIS